MANRVMQQKELKRKKAKRLFPRKYSSDIVCPRTHSVDRTLAAEAGQRALSGIPTMFMRGTTSLEEAELRARNAYIEAMFPRWCGLTPNKPRQDVIKRVRELLHDLPVEMQITLTKSEFHREIMLWKDDGTYVLIFEDLLKQTLSRSINYGSKQQLMLARNRRVRWRSTIALSSG